MASNMIDSVMFKDQYGTEKMRRVFSDENLAQKWLDTWAALALAEAELKIIPEAAAKEIAEKAKWQNLDFNEIREGFKKTSHPLMPQIRSFEKACSKEAGGYIHWGATTQDIMDTASVLTYKEAIGIIERQLKEILKLLLELAEKYKELPMAGRTHGQHALPITLGSKFAIWADEAGRDIERLNEAKKRVLTGQLAGGAGTLASLGEKGLAVRNLMCEKLGLNHPVTNTHTSRDSIAEFSYNMAITAGLIGKMANEIINLQRTEIGEIEEGFVMGKVGSSTMPQKRNPMICENLMSLTRLVINNSALSFYSMFHEHERDMSYWQSEWLATAESAVLLSGAMEQMEDVLRNLIVHEKNIERNLFLTKGLIVSEAIMMELGRHIGRQTAHDIIYESCMKAFEDDSRLVDVLLLNPEVTKHMSDAEIRSFMDPKNYVGAGKEYVELAKKAWSRYTD